MPNYEYKCPKCETEAEVWGAKVEDPAPECPACLGAPVQMLRQISLGIFRMVGGGWTRSNHNKWSYNGPKSST